MGMRPRDGVGAGGVSRAFVVGQGGACARPPNPLGMSRRKDVVRRRPAESCARRPLRSPHRLVLVGLHTRKGFGNRA